MFINRIFFFTFLCFIIAINDVVATSDKSEYGVQQSLALDSLSPKEIIVYMNQGLDNLTIKIHQIEHIDQLNELKNGRLGQLENYFNAYGTTLTKEEQSKLLTSIKQVKKELDLRIKTVDLGYGDDESFKKGMERRLDLIVGQINKKKEKYATIKKDLVLLLGNYDVYLKSNTSVDVGWQKGFKNACQEVEKRLEEEIPEYDNQIKKFTWTWTIETYKIEKSTSRLTRLDKKISKLRKEFVKSYSVDPFADDNEGEKGKKGNCIKKISKLSAKKELLIVNQGKVIDKDIIKLQIVLCKKYLLPKEGNHKSSYWGIQSVSSPPAEKINKKEGILTIENEFKLQERFFEDIGAVTFKLKRKAIEIEKDVVVKSEEENIDWSLSLKTNENKTITILDITPLSEKKMILKLGLKDVFWIVCKGDLRKANEALLSDIRQNLKLNIK